MTDEEYMNYYNQLVQLVEPLRQYYDIDKIKPYSVYVWTKDTNESNDWDGENLFDIQANEIVFYVKDHKIIEEAKPIIKNIQEHLKIEKKLRKEVNK